ncbi:MAG: flagellar FlbD family protein [Capsulimonas sp.]|jgi:flagellar protein FlbD|nr:flagellar FlbD family protein [Capsulimonas sp.]
MITVTRFDHSEFIVNADLIEFVESLPDTHITLVTGKKLLVRQTAQQVVDLVLEYRRQAGPILWRPTNSHTERREEALE